MHGGAWRCMEVHGDASRILIVSGVLPPPNHHDFAAKDAKGVIKETGEETYKE